MATKEEVLQAIADEKAQVQARLDELVARIAALEEQVANGGTVTAADLDEIKNGVQNIFTPAA